MLPPCPVDVCAARSGALRLISSVAGIESTIEEPGERLGGHWLEDMPVEAGRPGRRNVERLGAAADGDGQELRGSGDRGGAAGRIRVASSPGISRSQRIKIRPSVERESEGPLRRPGAPGPNTEGRDHRHEGRPRVWIVLDDEDLEVPRPGPAQNFHPGERRRATARIPLLRRALSGCCSCCDPAQEVETALRSLPRPLAAACPVPSASPRLGEPFLGFGGRRGEDTLSSGRHDVVGSPAHLVPGPAFL